MEEHCRKSRTLARCFATCLSFAVCCRAQSSTSLSHPLRFWIDEYAFSTGETTILREEIAEAGSSVAVVAGETQSTFLSVKGYYAPEQWDIYWTGRQGCVQALPHAVPGHKISCVPGLHELTMKDRLVARLTQFYGEGAFDIIPRSYLLPTQYWQWRLWLAAQEPAARGEMWVLKEERHRGKGVHVMPLHEAKEKAKVRRLAGKFDLTQAYIANQMTVVGRRFYVRLWAVVTSSFPLRAYLYDGGVVVFGNAAPDDRKKMTSDDFIVNLWHLGRTTEAAPWSVAEFRTYVDNLTGSRTAFDTLWRKMQRSLGLTFAAGVPSMRFSAASFPVAAASATFELVGIDFLVDENMKPWLLEVNAVPSLARKVINCEKEPGGCTADGEAESIFDIEKEKLVHSLFKVLQATAGTNLTQQNASAEDPNGPKLLTLAELMKRWKSNATDLAAMNKSNSTNTSILADLGWKSASHEDSSKESGGLSLSNSGRELKSVEIDEKKSSEDSNQSSSPSPEKDPAEKSPLQSDGEEPKAPDVSDSSQDSQDLSQQETAPNRGNEPSTDAPFTPHIHHVARAKSVAEATNLNKYVPESERTIPARKAHGLTGDSADHELILEQHLMEASVQEIEVALANHFLPLMMVPEAAAYSAAHQTRGTIFPQTQEKHEQGLAEALPLWMRIVFLPFRPIVSAYGGLGRILERIRVGIVVSFPEINYEVTMGVSSVIPGADWLFMRGYQLFGWGDRQGTVEAFSVLPQHALDQKLSDHIKKVTKA